MCSDLKTKNILLTARGEAKIGGAHPRLCGIGSNLSATKGISDPVLEVDRSRDRHLARSASEYCEGR